jgi:3-dehydroquinate synthase
MNETATLEVDLGERGYDIVAGDGLVAAAGRFLEPVLERPRVFVVTDDNVAPLYLATLEASLDGAGIGHSSVILPAGEGTKDLDHLGRLTDAMLAARVERETTVVALGGGVVGDIAGFAASVVLRGLPLVQIPTTLLAQVDSSVGGKTAVNTGFGKNLLGTFHQPRLVLADIGTLETLPPRQFRAGYAELVKTALIHDSGFFAWLETAGPALTGGEGDARRRAVLDCCAFKAAIVGEDERERGRRALLNLGHTFGHALEAEAGYGGALLHGEAVAVGTVLAFDLSVRLGRCPPEDGERVRRHLAGMGLPTELAAVAGPSWTSEILIAHMMQDKKVQDGTLAFILLEGIGKAFLARDIDLAEVRALLDAALGA